MQEEAADEDVEEYVQYLYLTQMGSVHIPCQARVRRYPQQEQPRHWLLVPQIKILSLMRTSYSGGGSRWEKQYGSLGLGPEVVMQNISPLLPPSRSASGV